MKRWWIIRHIRYFWHLQQVNRWYAMWERLGYFPVNAGHDYAQLDRIWRGDA